jgi:hypothetical protein
VWKDIRTRAEKCRGKQDGKKYRVSVSKADKTFSTYMYRRCRQQQLDIYGRSYDMETEDQLLLAATLFFGDKLASTCFFAIKSSSSIYYILIYTVII